MSPHSDVENKKSLIALSWVSFFWSTATMMVFSVLHIFLTEVLGASHKDVGHLEGLIVFSTFASKFIAGILSDIIQTRKPIIIIGTILSFLVKIMFGMAHSIVTVGIAQFIDRISKGVRSSPTDALIADLSQGGNRGRFFGIRQSLNTFGAAAGTLCAVLGMKAMGGNHRAVFFLAIIPGVFALIILVTRVKQPKINHEIPGNQGGKKKSQKWHWRHIKYLPPIYWGLLGVVAILMMARFSTGFLTFRLRSFGVDPSNIPAVFFGYEVIHASVAYFIGCRADQVDRHKLLLLGFFVLILTNLLLFSAVNAHMAMAGVLLAGLHMGMTQGLIGTLIAESSPADIRGTAFSVYYLMCALFNSLGNVIAGDLSHNYGISATFMGGFLETSLSALLLFFLIIYKNKKKSVT